MKLRGVRAFFLDNRNKLFQRGRIQQARTIPTTLECDMLLPNSMSKEVSAMKKALLSVVLSVLITLPVWAALKVGDKAPDFSARASLAGKKFTFFLKEALKK